MNRDQRDYESSKASPFNSPASTALWRLMDVARGAGRPFSDAWLFGLAWLAAGRLAATGRLPGVTGIEDLLQADTWDAVIAAGLPHSTSALAWNLRASASQEQALRSKALSEVAALIDRCGTERWDILDAPWYFGVEHRSQSPAIALAPELCDFLIELVGDVVAARVWVPFDPTGQLVIRAARRGWNVLAAGPLRRNDPHLEFLAAIDSSLNREDVLRVSFDQTAAGRRSVDVDYTICVPPFGEKLRKDSDWRSWEVDDKRMLQGIDSCSRLGLLSSIQLDRSEPWSIAASWPNTRHRGVFVVSPGVLFARGQEERLRQHLVESDGPIFAVATLPSRLFSGSSIASAVLVLDRREEPKSVRLIDATELTLGSGGSARHYKPLDTKALVALISRREVNDRIAVDVTPEDIAAQGYNLVPARYLHRTTTSEGPRVPLGELVEVIRPAASVKDGPAIVVQEAGIPDLDRWQPISAPLVKTTHVRTDKLSDHALALDDIIVSIKGTLGKVGILGKSLTQDFAGPSTVSKAIPRSPSQVESQGPVVASQSCIALRIRRNARDKLLPAFLMMYLRSDEFRKQIGALRVGATIAHVTPSTLLQEVHVPMLPIREQRAYVKKYEELCRLESEVHDATRRIEELRRSVWSVSPNE